MIEFLDLVKQWIWQHHRVLASSVIGVLAGGAAAYLVAEVLGRLDRGGREPVGRLITVVAGLLVATLVCATIASMPFANTGGTRTDTAPLPSEPGASVLTQIASALHPADYAYLSAILVFAIGAGLWAERRRRRPWERLGNPETSRLLLGAGSLLLVTLWIFQRGVEQLSPETRSAPEFFGTIAGAGVLAMAIVQGLRTLLPLRGVFHRVTLERWIEDATTAPAPGLDDDDVARPRPKRKRVPRFVDKEQVELRRRTFRSITRLARGPVSTDRYALLDLPIEQLCGQIAAGADRLLDAPFAATLETRGSRREPATVKEVITALAAGGDKDIDDYLKLAGTMVPGRNATQESDDAEAGSDGEGAASSESESESATLPSLPDIPSAPSDTAQDTQDYVRLRASISQRIQRNIDGLQISTTFWWRRVLRSLAFTVCGVLGLSLFNGRITYTVMCAIVGGFVATASRDLIAVVEKGRR